MLAWPLPWSNPLSSSSLPTTRAATIISKDSSPPAILHIGQNRPRASILRINKGTETKNDSSVDSDAVRGGANRPLPRPQWWWVWGVRACLTTLRTSSHSDLGVYPPVESEGMKRRRWMIRVFVSSAYKDLWISPILGYLEIPFSWLTFLKTSSRKH